jgi:hypothetical protein
MKRKKDGDMVIPKDRERHAQKHDPRKRKKIEEEKG